MRSALAILACATVATACGTPTSEPRWRAAGQAQARRGGAIIVSTPESVSTLDPALAYNEVTTYVTAHLLDTLVSYAPSFAEAPQQAATLVPQLAESWQVRDSGRLLRFTLRQGLRYADGTPIVAAHFALALERVLSKADSPYAAFLRPIAGAEDFRAKKAQRVSGLRAIDERTLDIELSAADASFLFVLAMKFTAPLSAAHLARGDDELSRAPPASGAYYVHQWRRGERIVLRRNPHHWDSRRGWIDEITFLEGVPRDVELLLFERGELDTCFQPSAAEYLWLATQPAWAPYVHRLDLMTSFGERMNVTRKPFSDVRVRRALNYGVDKAHFVRLLHGTAVPAHGILPPGLAGRDPDLRPYPYDPKRARALLAEAGYPDGLTLDYVTIASDEPRKLATALQADLASAGVRLRVREVSFPTYLEQVGAKDGAPFSFTSWVQDFPDPASFLDARFHSRMISETGSLNDTFYKNPEVDRLIDAARAEQDPAVRAALYRKVERILYDDAPWIWGYHRSAIEVVSPALRDYHLHPVWIRDYSYAWLDLDDRGQRVPASLGGSR